MGRTRRRAYCSKMGFVDKMKALFIGIYENANLIKWECFALTVVVFFQSVQGPTNPQYALTGAVLTASMWLISGGSADVHFCVTLYKVFVSYETKLHAGLARLIGQGGGLGIQRDHGLRLRRHPVRPVRLRD